MGECLSSVCHCFTTVQCVHYKTLPVTWGGGGIVLAVSHGVKTVTMVTAEGDRKRGSKFLRQYNNMHGRDRGPQ